MDDEDRTPPIKVGDILKEQEVINTGKKNDGVVKYEDYIIFVNDCQKGDIVSFKVEKVLKNFGIGKQLEDTEDFDDEETLDEEETVEDEETKAEELEEKTEEGE